MAKIGIYELAGTTPEIEDKLLTSYRDRDFTILGSLSGMNFTFKPEQAEGYVYIGQLASGQKAIVNPKARVIEIE